MADWNRDNAVEALLGRINYESTPAPIGLGVYRLRAIRELLARLGHPERQIPFVHVAGTKGKGSTSTMIAELLAERGYRVGLYTSPHLERIEERMLVEGEPVNEAAFCEAVARVLDVVAELDRELAVGTWEGTPATFFDLLTAVAWIAFEQAKLDVAVFEVGLGGRVDSTNAATPCVSVITPISMDHMRQLGDRLELIASEKAGIIKQGIPVVIGKQDPVAKAVLESRALELNARQFVLGRDFEVAWDQAQAEQSYPQPRFVFTHNDSDRESILPREIADLQLSLPGLHQIGNAAVAIQAVDVALRTLQPPRTHSPTCPVSEPEWIRRALARARIAGRVEKLQTQPTVVIDVAHNVAAITSLMETLRVDLIEGRKTIVLAISEDKDADGILDQIAGKFDRYIVTRFVSNPRATDPQGLQRMLETKLSRIASARTRSSVQVFQDSSEVLGWLRDDVLADELVCFAGSTFLVAEVRSRLLSEPLVASRPIK